MTTQIAKIHKAFFYLLIFFLPVQLGKHFWPDWTRVLGLRLDYLSPAFYFTDILILGILVSWIIEKIKNNFRHAEFSSASDSHEKRILKQVQNDKGCLKQKALFLFVFIFLVINCFFSQNQPAAFYKLVKLAEFVLLGTYIVKNITIDKLFNCSTVAAIIYSSLIAIVQFLKQGSLGGIFYWLGERTFTSGTPGIAQTVWNGELLLRPYAAFPHPNVLAGFLVISLLLMTQFPISNFQFPMKIQFLKFSKLIQILAIILGIVALFLTFSRVAWVVFGLLAVPFLLRAFKPSRIFLITGSICLIGLISLIWIPIQDQSITYRQDLNLAAVKIWESSLLFGVGLNNFLVRLPEFYQSHGEIRWFQPAHNIFLMILAETGLVGLAMFLWLLVLTYRRLFNCSIVKLLMPLTAILVLGLFDHYFYTLQQGQILLTLVLGLSWAAPSCDKIER